MNSVLPPPLEDEPDVLRGFREGQWQLAIEPVHQELQRELATISPESKHIIASKAGHNIQLDEPQLVLDAITELVSRYRSNP